MGDVVIEGDMRSDLQKLVSILINVIKENLYKELSFLKGRAGQLLFLYEAAKYDNGLIDADWLSEQLNSLISEAKAVLPDCSISYGMSGIAWLYQYILESENESTSSLGNVDLTFSAVLSTEVWNGEFEYILGLAGYTPFLSRRHQTSIGKKNVLSLLKFFRGLATYEDDDCFWQTPLSSSFRINTASPNYTEINLGLAHGHTSVLAALVSMSKIPALAVDAKMLLNSGCNWLIKQQQDPLVYGSFFPAVCGMNKQSRLGWCYGDATIALTLARASKILKRDDLECLSRKIATHSSQRHSSAAVFDAGLCHGSSGLALVFYLLFLELGDSVLKDTALRWVSNFQIEFNVKGLKGISKALDRAGMEREESFCLLEGYAGVGLVIITLLTQKSDWVDALLLA